MCVTDPGTIPYIDRLILVMFRTLIDLCRRTSLRHALILSGLCVLSPLVGLTTWAFVLDSFPLNLYMIYLSYQFYRAADSRTSRKLFRYSLIYLPALMILMFVSKNRYHGSAFKSECTSTEEVEKAKDFRQDVDADKNENFRRYKYPS